MPEITHQQQQEIWEREHQQPHVLLQMDSAAIKEAIQRSGKAGLKNTTFFVQDATQPWQLESDSFDFASDLI